MKKIILFLTLLFSLTIFAQKTVYIFNGSSQPIYIAGLKTKSLSVPNTYLTTNNFSVPNGLLQPGEIFILENVSSNTRFPFSFNSTQFSNISVVNWRRTTNGGTSFITVSNTNAYSNNGLTQVFDYASFRIGIGGNLGSFSLGVGLPTVVTGSNWIADYTVNTDPAFPNLQETVITISNL